MANEFAHVGDIGVKFEFTFYEKDGTTPVDLDGKTVTMKVEKRGGAGTTWTINIDDGPNGVGSFTTTLVSDLDVPGKWILMGRVAGGGKDTHFKRDTFDVLPVLAGA